MSCDVLFSIYSHFNALQPTLILLSNLRIETSSLEQMDFQLPKVQSSRSHRIEFR